MTKDTIDLVTGPVPPSVTHAEDEAHRVEYPLSSSRETGALLRVLAASKPGGRLLELGGGVGVGTAWLLDGMSGLAHLDTVEINAEACEMITTMLGEDPRLEVHCTSTTEFTEAHGAERYDLIFADAGHPKFFERDATVALLAVGGILVADDLIPQPKWTGDHPRLVETYRRTLHEDDRLRTVMIDWGAGVSVSVRI